MASKYSNMTFKGYRRENGRVGVRNHVLILPVDDISNAACEAVANNVKGTLAIPHAYGRLQFGEDLELHFRTMIGTGANPNVAAVVVIGIEPGWTKKIADGIRETGKPVAEFSIEQKGDFETIRAEAGRPRNSSTASECSARNARSPSSGSRPNAARATRRRAWLLPDGRQHVRQAAARGHHRLLRRDLRDHRRRAHLPEARDQRGSRRALVQDVEGLSGRRDLRPPDRRPVRQPADQGQHRGRPDHHRGKGAGQSREDRPHVAIHRHPRTGRAAEIGQRPLLHGFVLGGGGMRDADGGGRCGDPHLPHRAGQRGRQPDRAGHQDHRQPAHGAHHGRACRCRRLRHPAPRDDHRRGRRRADRDDRAHCQWPQHRGRGAGSPRVLDDQALPQRCGALSVQVERYAEAG
jgi:hypothetical protein